MIKFRGNATRVGLEFRICEVKGEATISAIKKKIAWHFKKQIKV